MAQSRIPLSKIFPHDFPAADAAGQTVPPPWLEAARERRQRIVRSAARLKLTLDALLLLAFLGCAVLYGAPLGSRALLMAGDVLAWLVRLPAAVAPNRDSVGGLLGATVSGLFPVFALLGWRLFETELILRSRLAASARMLLARSTEVEVARWLAWRLVFAALVLGAIAWWATLGPTAARWRPALQALRDSPGSGWSLAGIALANSLLLGWLVHSTRQPSAPGLAGARRQEEGGEPGAT